MNNAMEYPTMSSRSSAITDSFGWNRSTSRSTRSHMTNGLNSAIFRTSMGMLSSGIITLDRNRNMLPLDIVASVAVSSEVNKYPTTMPQSVKKVAASTKIAIERLKLGTICAEKK